MRSFQEDYERKRDEEAKGRVDDDEEMALPTTATAAMERVIEKEDGTAKAHVHGTPDPDAGTLRTKVGLGVLMICALLVIIVAANSGSSSSGQAAQPHALLVVLDGFEPTDIREAINDGTAPNLDLFGRTFSDSRVGGKCHLGEWATKSKKSTDGTAASFSTDFMTAVLTGAAPSTANPKETILARAKRNRYSVGAAGSYPLLSAPKEGEQCGVLESECEPQCTSHRTINPGTVMQETTCNTDTQYRYEGAAYPDGLHINMTGSMIRAAHVTVLHVRQPALVDNATAEVTKTLATPVGAKMAAKSSLYLADTAVGRALMGAASSGAETNSNTLLVVIGAGGKTDECFLSIGAFKSTKPLMVNPLAPLADMSVFDVAATTARWLEVIFPTEGKTRGICGTGKVPGNCK